MKHYEFQDVEEHSRALQHADVWAIQTSKGRFRGELTQFAISDWSIQHVSFSEGQTACRGASPRTLHALVVPLSRSPKFRLLGQEVTETSFGFYTPGSEHGDTSGAGACKVVLVPPAGLIDQIERELSLILPRAGAYHQVAPVHLLDALRCVIRSAHRAACTDPSVLSKNMITRRIDEQLREQIYALISEVQPRASRGRPQILRSAIIRQLNMRLSEISDDPIYATDLCEEFGISFPTLRRIFMDWYGIPPAKYLLLHRYYLARRLLKRANYASVTAVAHACGFWDLSRFAVSYRALFNELPSATLRKSAD